MGSNLPKPTATMQVLPTELNNVAIEINGDVILEIPPQKAINLSFVLGLVNSMQDLTTLKNDLLKVAIVCDKESKNEE